MKLEHIVFIYGMPRSRTSMVAGIFERCGAFFGKCRHSKVNPKGIYENEGIRFVCFNNIGRKGWDIKNPKIITDCYKGDTKMADLMSAIFEYQGYTGGCAAFKNAYYHVCDEWIDLFDNVTLIGTKRNQLDVFKSLRKVFKNYKKLSREQLENLYNHVQERSEHICNKYPDNAHIIDTDKIFNGDFTEIKPIIDANPFLQWDENSVSSWVDKDYNMKYRNGQNYKTNSIAFRT